MLYAAKFNNYNYKINHWEKAQLNKPLHNISINKLNAA